MGHKAHSAIAHSQNHRINLRERFSFLIIPASVPAVHVWALPEERRSGPNGTQVKSKHADAPEMGMLLGEARRTWILRYDAWDREIGVAPECDDLVRHRIHGALIPSRPCTRSRP